MLNNPTKEPLLPVTNSGPRPGDFPVGSPESRAAARLLAKKQNAAPIPVMVTHVSGVGVIDGDAEHEPKEWSIDDELSFSGTATYCPLDPETMGSSPVCPMTRQELSILQAKQRKYEDRREAYRLRVDVDAPEAASASSPTRANEPDNDVLDRESEEAAREARVNEYGKSLVRRSHTRPSPHLRRAWRRWGL